VVTEAAVRCGHHLRHHAHPEQDEDHGAEKLGDQFAE
jgi:hypothetical protein